MANNLTERINFALTEKWDSTVSLDESETIIARFVLRAVLNELDAARKEGERAESLARRALELLGKHGCLECMQYEIAALLVEPLARRLLSSPEARKVRGEK